MAKIITDENRIKEFLESRYVETVLPSKEKAEEMLSSGRQLTFYLGIDPTGPDIHLGHTTNLFVLKELFQLGHKIVLLIGDFTAMIGDPTDKEAVRRPLTGKEVKENMRTYLDQVRKILSKDSFETKYNGKWYRKMLTEEWLKLTSLFTQQQMVGRDMFQERIKKDKPISLQEFVYPVLQGYDSVAMEVDGEIGGKDQMFNMMVGRDLVNKILGKEKLVITTRLLENLATGKKIMSKSEGQYISLNDSPQEMFGKTMAMPDSAIVPLLAYATELPDSEVDRAQKKLSAGENPRNLKEELAFELVRMYHGEKEAKKAKDEFRKVFSEGQLPEEIKEYKFSGDSIVIVDLLEGSGTVGSRSEAKRLIDEGAVKVNGKTVSGWDYEVERGDVIKVGPRKFVRAV
ncbi:MAG: tyrosine--tRNA ligase [Patescibacteria group bacterium]